MALADGYPSPSLDSYVNDFEGLLSDGQIKELDDVLSNLEGKTSIQMTVVTVDSFGSQTAEDYAIGIGDTWGVGQKGENNGIVFLLSAKERQAYIRVAEGLKNSANQSKVENVVDDTVIPLCKKGDYSGAIVAGTKELADYFIGLLNETSVSTTVSPITKTEAGPTDLTVLWVFLGILGGGTIIGLLIYLIRKYKSDKDEINQDITKKLESLIQNVEYIQKMENKFPKDLWQPEYISTADFLESLLKNFMDKFDRANSIKKLVLLRDESLGSIEDNVVLTAKVWKMREEIQNILDETKSQIEKVSVLRTKVARSLSS